ncbi:hypothetical protein [Vibrio splendidus]|uniref:hypothetical protein n=1 Tax=Vibrio splendidus TaxID=29497 RepID=UPI000C82B94A|nr:hypothetical protein [Vibrio splendidus]PMI28859.1 hypothetical protein BCU48_02580 [Vibrio splendidus]
MDTSSEDLDLDDIKKIKWKTHLSRKVDKFREVISDDEVFEKYFGEAYLNRLIEKSQAISSIIFKLGVVYTILMLSLYSSQHLSNSEFEVFGYGFKNLSSYKEILLLLAAVISPVSSIYTVYQKYLDALAKECLSKLSPDVNIKEFYKHIWFNQYFDGLVIDRYPGGHGITTFLMGSFVVILIFFLMTLVLASFFIQVNVIYDVAKNPSLSEHVNLFVVGISISSIIFTWLLGIMQLPMPEINHGMYTKLISLEESDPERYKKIMRKMSKEDSKRDARNIIVLSALSYLTCYTAISVFWFSSSMDDMSVFLSHALPGAFITMFFSNEIINTIRKFGWMWFFRKYPEESSNRFKVFGRVRFVLSLLKILVPCTFTIIYSFYALG